MPNEKFPSQNGQICLPGGVNKFLPTPLKKLFTILTTKRAEGMSIGQETTSIDPLIQESCMKTL